MSQKFTTGLSVSTNSSLMIKRKLSGILYGNYSLLLQFEKLKENNSSEIILVPKKGGNPNFLEGKKFIQDYLDKQVKESLLNSANPTKAKLRGNNSNPKSMVLNISTNEGSKRNFSKTTLTNTTGETVNNMNTARDSETNKIEKISMSKISSSHTGSPEISLCKSSLNTKCDGKSSALSDSRSIGLQKWRNPIVGYKQVTKDTSQETENAVNFVQTQLISDKSSGCKVPTPLVVDMKSSKVNAKENSNNEDDDECVVIVKEVEKQKDTPVSGTKRKYDKLLHRNANEQSENTTDDSIIIIDDGPEDECKKRECICDDSVIIVEDTDSKQTKKRRNRSSSVLGIQRRKGKNRKEYESLSSENKGKQLQSYESVLKKDFIPLNSCASVVTYVNEYQFSRGFQRSKNDAVQSDMLSVYIDKGKDFYSSTRFQQSTSQSIAPQQHQYQHQPQPQTQPQPPAIVGDNICSVKKVAGKQTGLRPIVIDGSNVAMGHTNGREFSCEGLKICIDYFLERKHKVIAFVPRFRQGRCTNADLLSMLEKRGLVTYTPSRRVNGKLQVSYDDRFIVQYAAECGGVIVSTDNFRDLLEENPNWRETIEQRLLMFTWAGDVLMFPHDPLGRGGPTLEALLRFPD